MKKLVTFAVMLALGKSANKVYNRRYVVLPFSHRLVRYEVGVYENDRIARHIDSKQSV